MSVQIDTEVFYFDCCGEKILPGQSVYNIGDAFEVILFCQEHALGDTR